VTGSAREADGAPVTVTVARRVAPGREAEFERWADELTSASARFPGFLGAGLLRPGRLGEDWHVVYRFDSPDHLATWERSPVRTELLSGARELMETTAVNRMSGLETWFELPGRTSPAPPRWKMFLVSLTAIATLQILLHVAVGDHIGSWPPLLRVAVLAGVVTALMTWVVMPRAARILSGWLYAGPRRR
jgi:antibiotic biosynthesis monooxygenase (ABM) superfamily enzyme